MTHSAHSASIPADLYKKFGKEMIQGKGEGGGRSR